MYSSGGPVPILFLPAAQDQTRPRPNHSHLLAAAPFWPFLLNYYHFSSSSEHFPNSLQTIPTHDRRRPSRIIQHHNTSQRFLSVAIISHNGRLNARLSLSLRAPPRASSSFPHQTEERLLPQIPLCRSAVTADQTFAMEPQQPQPHNHNRNSQLPHLQSVLPPHIPSRTANSTPISSPGLFSPGNPRSNMSLPPQPVSEGTTPAPTHSPYLHPLQTHKVRE